MLVLGKNQTKLLVDRLQKADELEACVDEVRKMVEIKSTLLWRADAACSCVGNGPATTLYMELSLLENALGSLEQGDIAAGTAQLREYLDVLPDQEVA